MPHSAKITIRCQQDCKYCYEAVSRQENADAGKQAGNGVDVLIETVRDLKSKGKIQGAPNLHGGEPLLLPRRQLEKLLSEFYEQFGSTSIQTNAALIRDEHIEMFLKYKTSVGVSIDGHEELNDGRWMGNEELTRKNTAIIVENIRKLKEKGIDVGIIAVVNKHNGSRERLPKLKEFLLWLKSIGIKGGRLNMIELDFPDEAIREELQMSLEDEINFYEEMSPFLIENELQYAPFVDAVDAMLGMSHRTCVTTQCDPYHTLGEQPIYMDGSIGNCLRTSKDGTVFLAEMSGDTNRVSNERYVILRQIPMEEGGCGGCRFWNVCNAHCPGSAENGDWRNKSEHCESLYALFSTIEKTYKRLMPSLKLTTENHGIPDAVMFSKIKDGTASDLVFSKMFSRSDNRGGRRGAY